MAAILLSRLMNPISPFLTSKKSLLRNISNQHKLLPHLVTIFQYAIALSLSCLSLLLSLLPDPCQLPKRPKSPPPADDPAVRRALSQILSLVAAVPASSRKYETVRSLADRLMDENLRDGYGSINRAAVSEAFFKAVCQLEAELAGASRRELGGRRVRWVLSEAARSLGLDGLLLYGCGSGAGSGSGSGSGSGEKLAAELFWLARRLVECGAAEEAVSFWGSATGLARLALSAELRLQASLVRVSVYLFKQARELEEVTEEEEDETKREEARKTKMLMTWLPLLCRVTNGIDVPLLSSIEKAEMVAILEEMISALEPKKQEKVLALWLHHFTSSPDSDWPNLQHCYASWYAASRKLMVAQ